MAREKRRIKKNRGVVVYRVSFSKTGCSYSRCFQDKGERDGFADSMRKAGYNVYVWDDVKK